MWRSPKRTVLVGLTILLVGTAGAAAGTERPNVIFILADDLGYGDLGSYGQQVIRTPSLDRMAAEGIRFTQFYAGATVCAPSRSVLMTGQHTGHTHVRGNARGTAQSLREEDVTVAEVLQSAGYATGLFGKWGLGEVGMEGHPLSQGFDAFYGYLNQVHAHNYYPEFLWRGLQKVSLRNKVERTPRPYGGFEGGWATERKEYSHDLIIREALAWLEEQKDAPFFLYLALTIPHANNEATRAVGESCSRRTTDRTTSRTMTCSGSTPPAICAASSGTSTTAASGCLSWPGGRERFNLDRSRTTSATSAT